MTETAINYAKVLYDLSVSGEDMKETKRIFQEEPALIKSLGNPLVEFDAKQRVIDRIIPETMRNFVKVVCRHRKTELLDDIFEAYEDLIRKQNRTLRATLKYVTAPKKDQLEGIQEFLCREFHAKQAEVRMIEDKSLIGGFILQAEGNEYDWSLRGRWRRLEQKLTRR